MVSDKVLSCYNGCASDSSETLQRMLERIVMFQVISFGILSGELVVFIAWDVVDFHKLKRASPRRAYILLALLATSQTLALLGVFLTFFLTGAIFPQATGAHSVLEIIRLIIPLEVLGVLGMITYLIGRAKTLISNELS